MCSQALSAVGRRLVRAAPRAAAGFLRVGIVHQQHHECRRPGLRRNRAASCPASFLRRRLIAATTRGYVPQRQMCPFMPLTISASLGCGFLLSSPTAPRIMPGVHQPHCMASASMNASCTGCSLPSGARPSMVTIRLPAAGPDLRDARAVGCAVDQHRAGGALAFAAAVLGSGEVEIVAQDAEQGAIRIGIDPPFGPIDIQFGDPGHIVYSPPNSHTIADAPSPQALWPSSRTAGRARNVEREFHLVARHFPFEIQLHIVPIEAGIHRE